jgi:hypothetical protein
MIKHLGKTLSTTLIIAVMLLGGVSCKKSDTMTPANASMSATVNGSSVSFTVTVTRSNGLTIIQGTSSNYTLTIVLNLSGPGVFTLAAQATNYYATVSNNLGYSYSTDAANTGQITLSRASGSSNLYSGTFYFNANETSPTSGGGNISVTSGSCSNI